MLLGPIVLILAAAPLFCGQISPRGPLGPGPDARTISDDEWYQTTRVAGAAFLVGGMIWLAAAVLLPGRFDTLRQEHETIAFIGAAAVAAATVVSTRYVEGAAAGGSEDSSDLP